MLSRLVIVLFLIIFHGVFPLYGYAANPAITVSSDLITEYKIISMIDTSNLLEEMNVLAEKGWEFVSIHQGIKKFGGHELVVIMGRGKNSADIRLHKYHLIATAKPKILENELNKASGQGYYFRDQTVCDTTYGGEEMVVIMEKTGEYLRNHETTR